VGIYSDTALESKVLFARQKKSKRTIDAGWVRPAFYILFSLLFRYHYWFWRFRKQIQVILSDMSGS